MGASTTAFDTGPGIAEVDRAAWDEPVVDIANPQASVDALSARLVDVSKRPADVSDLKTTLGIPPGQVLTPQELGLLAVRVDSANNVRYARPAVHLLLASYPAAPTPAACRDDIYKRILHVPIDDPDLGLTKAMVPGTP